MHELSSLFRPTQPSGPFLLAADIDGTLLGDEQGAGWLEALSRAYPGSFYLALVTGRSLPSISALIEESRLPQPDFICCDVGTELLVCANPENVLGKKYTAQVSPDWDLEMIYALGEGEGVWRQTFPEGQPRFQVGFDWDGQAHTLAAFYDRIPSCQEFYILPSYQTDIDVLPFPLGKGTVVQFLQEDLGLDPARVVVAGDAGNDKQMFETGYKGILPANAHAELKTVACAPRHYHSHLPAARGVLDGLKFFGFIEEGKRNDGVDS
jgi:hydroxymethylpyrimidine pyrophosphatase-like HAD family hydrolase